MIAIIDYGVGNLFSLEHSLMAVGANAIVTGEPEAIHRADRVILPGVGAFGDAAAKLRQTGLDAVVKRAAGRGTPLVGVVYDPKVRAFLRYIGQDRALDLTEVTADKLLAAVR